MCEFMNNRKRFAVFLLQQQPTLQIKDIDYFCSMTLNVSNFFRANIHTHGTQRPSLIAISVEKGIYMIMHTAD